LSRDLKPFSQKAVVTKLYKVEANLLLHTILVFYAPRIEKSTPFVKIV